MHFRESLGTVFHQEKRSPVQDLTAPQPAPPTTEPEVPCKKFKLENTTTTNLQEEPPESDVKNQASLAFNLAARFLTARAQWIHHQQVLLQHQQNSEDPGQKWSQLQMLQMAHLQAYLASLHANANKTETPE